MMCVQVISDFVSASSELTLVPAENRCDIILASPTAVFGQPEINASRTQYIPVRTL